MSTSSAAEQVAGSTDIFSEILLRLPPISLLRFKCVCKRWLSLISDPRFCHLHASLHIHQTLPSLLFPLIAPSPSLPYLMILPLTTTATTSSVKVRVLNLDFLEAPHAEVFQSCNGLLLCGSGRKNYFVCNPTTRKFVPLRLPRRRLTKNEWRTVYLAFEPSRSPHFRVVWIRMIPSLSSRMPLSSEFKVYSSETDSWVHLSPCSIAASCSYYSRGVYCNNAIHWCDPVMNRSVHYEVGTGNLKSLLLPWRNAQVTEQGIEYLEESRGCVYLIIARSSIFDVWELKEDCCLWCLRHTIGLSPARVVFPELRWDLASFAMPLYIVCHKEQGSSSMLVLLVAGTAVCYDPERCTWKKLCDFKPDMTADDAVAGFFCYHVLPYFESLSLV